MSEGLAGLSVNGAPDVIGIGSAPHEVLFARCAVVVHHGGAGTTAAAVRAGVPQVVVPHAADQPYWGRRMADLGVAAAAVARKDLTPSGSSGHSRSRCHRKPATRHTASVGASGAVRTGPATPPASSTPTSATRRMP